MLKRFDDPLPRYIVNFDELGDSLKSEILSLIDKALDQRCAQINTNNIEAILEDIKSRLPSNQYEYIKKQVDTFINKKIVGSQKIEGVLLDIPPIIKTTQHDFIYEKDVFLVGLHVHQTGWKKQDRFHLIVNKKKLIDNISTKEVGEHKYFNTFFKVNANTPISFLLENNGGNSRQTMVDLEYIEGKESTITPPVIHPPIDPPGIPGLKDIKNEWDIAVIVNWESNTIADIDLHGFIGSKHVWYSHTSEDNFYLNFDFTNHIDNTNPEILSVKGYKNESLEIYIHNFKPTQLKEPVNIEVYSKLNGLLKEYNVTLTASNTYIIGVCSINLNTLEITDLHNQKRF